MLSPKRILAATDFSAAARRAVERAGQLARAHQAQLYLVHARPDWNLFCRTSGSAVGDHYSALLEQTDEALRTEVEYLEKIFGVHARGEIRTGRASEILAAAAEKIAPHLLVLGARGEHEAAGRPPFLGGTALKLIAQSEAAVLLVRKSGTSPYASAVAAVGDAREAASRVLAWALTMVPDGECHVVHAYDAPYVARMRARGVEEDAIRACVEEACRAARDSVEQVLLDVPSSGRVQTHLVCGEPVGALLSEIERLAPEIVVLGRHQAVPREAATRVVGTIVLRVAYHAGMDVLVTP